MSLDLSKTYSIKSNATRAMKGAVAKGTFTAAELEVVVVPTGFQVVIVPAAIPAPAPKTVRKAAAKQAGELDESQRAFLVHLVHAKADAFAGVPVSQRAGVKVLWKQAAYESDRPHSFKATRLPGLNSALVKRGYTTTEGPKYITITAAGIAAVVGS